jgi:hypothetical protein
MLKIRHLRLRSFTQSRQFGADLKFTSGLNVIYAGNSSGKSTSLQAIIFALGLERSLGPQLEIPLPYAMRERIHEHPDAEYEPVIESYVELELENSKGSVLTIHRDVVGEKDTKLIRTWNSARLSNSDAKGEQRDFFVLDPGAARREDGFHHYLAEFIGWELPFVPHFDGSDSPLYLEAIFPMLFVEQKRGWSAVQGPFPTFLRIQDVARRVLEFLLDLDAGKIRRERAELRRQLITVQQKWNNVRERLSEASFRVVRIQGASEVPTAEFAQGAAITIEVLYEDEWLPISTVTFELAEIIRKLESSEVPTSENVAPELQAKLDQIRERVDQLTAIVEEQKAIQMRLTALKVDLKRNQDALKLKKLGSELGRAASEHVCPTCHQAIDSELLPLVANVGMALEENITFVKSQIELYEATMSDSIEQLDDYRARYQAASSELNERQLEVRGLKQALLQPSSAPSRAIIEEVIRKQSFLDRLNSMQKTVDGVVDELRSIAVEWTVLQDRLKRLSKDDLTTVDLEKILLFEKSIQKHLSLYGFKSFQPTEIHLSRDNFRPLVFTYIKDEIVEKEINFEISASDAIRLKWAYYLSLLSISTAMHTNHCGLVILDEPGQQEMEVPSLHALLNWAAENVKDGQQVILATSEPLDSLNAALRGRSSLISFEGLILKPL